VDPAALAGADVFYERMETLLAAIMLDPEVRLPGYRRLALADRAQADGIEVAATLLDQLETLATDA
jgi:(2R)-3-sulfolactate dehydrogenase (NADP+)